MELPVGDQARSLTLCQLPGVVLESGLTTMRALSGGLLRGDPGLTDRDEFLVDCRRRSADRITAQLDSSMVSTLTSTARNRCRWMVSESELGGKMSSSNGNEPCGS